MRKFIFNLLFTEKEKAFIIHSLWNSAFNRSDNFDEKKNIEKGIICESLARELGI